MLGMLGKVNVWYLIPVAVISLRVQLLLCWNLWTIFVMIKCHSHLVVAYAAEPWRRVMQGVVDTIA